VSGRPGFAGIRPRRLLLQHIGTDFDVASVQRFNTDTGRFDTASYQDGLPGGDGFSIREGGSYLLHMKEVKTGFDVMTCPANNNYQP